MREGRTVSINKVEIVESLGKKKGEHARGGVKKIARKEWNSGSSWCRSGVLARSYDVARCRGSSSR
jgi:hypothetical protein